MSIQYGSTPITDIKYCDPQGTLKNVPYVKRNGSVLYTSEKTSENGVWTRSSDGKKYYISSGNDYFEPIPFEETFLQFQEGSWWYGRTYKSEDSFGIFGNDHDTVLEFKDYMYTHVETFTWSES